MTQGPGILILVALFDFINELFIFGVYVFLKSNKAVNVVFWGYVVEILSNYIPRTLIV